jgi:hypothetical protein
MCTYVNMKKLSAKASPIKKKERLVCSNIDLKRDSESAVRTVRGSEFQQSMVLLKKEEKNLVEPLAGLSKIGWDVLKEGGGI